MSDQGARPGGATGLQPRSRIKSTTGPTPRRVANHTGESGSFSKSKRLISEVHPRAVTAALFLAALARFFCLGLGLVLSAVIREIFRRFDSCSSLAISLLC